MRMGGCAANRHAAPARGRQLRGESMPSGCSDHRRRFIGHAAAAVAARDMATPDVADSVATFRSKPRPRPAPGVAAGRPGAAARLRTLAAREPRFHADASDGAHRAAYRQLRQVAPGTG